MKRKSVLLIIAILLLTVAFGACKSEDVYVNRHENNSQKIEEVFCVSSENINIIELVTNIYDEAELVKIVNYSNSIFDLNEVWKVEVIRKVNESYRVVYLGKEELVVLWFDSLGNKFFGDVYVAQCLLKEFEALEVGQSVADVQNIDPQGEYLFLYTGNDAPRESTHYTKDGWIVIVEYDENSQIIGISESLL